MFWFFIATFLLERTRSLPTPGSEITTSDLPFYYPKVSQQIISQSGNLPTLVSKRSSLLNTTDFEIGRQEIMDRLGLDEDDFVITKSHTDSANVVHIYASEVVNGVVVDNHNCAIHVQNGSVIAYSTSFTSSKANLGTRSTPLSPANPQITLDEAVKTASDIYKAPLDEAYKPKLVYLSTPSGDLALSRQFQLQDDTESIWYQVSVDASSGKVIQVINYYNDFQIKAIALPKVGASDGFEVIKDPVYYESSPKGWGENGTMGNNVISMIDKEIFIASLNQDFTNFTWQENQEPDSEENKNALIVNSFYIANVVHDISYQYGFDEESGNFQGEK